MTGPRYCWRGSCDPGGGFGYRVRLVEQFSGRETPVIQEIIITESNVLVNLSGSIYVEEAAQIRESLLGYIHQGTQHVYR